MQLELEIKIKIFNSVANAGKLNFVKFCHNNKYPLTTDTCSVAASAGHLDCLIYLHENNCPWDKQLVHLLQRTVI